MFCPWPIIVDEQAEIGPWKLPIVHPVNAIILVRSCNENHRCANERSRPDAEAMLARG